MLLVSVVSPVRMEELLVVEEEEMDVLVVVEGEEEELELEDLLRVERARLKPPLPPTPPLSISIHLTHTLQPSVPCPLVIPLYLLIIPPRLHRRCF